MALRGFVLGVGLDIVEVSRFHDILYKRGDDYANRFVKRVLNPGHEIARFHHLHLKRDPDLCVKYVAGCWALKEALFKTLDRDCQKQFAFNAWYRQNDADGKPTIWNDAYPFQDEQFHASISHDGGILAAVILRQKLA